MSLTRPHTYLIGLVRELQKIPRECEWVEFKENKAEPEEIGEYIAALANSAALLGKAAAFVVWGVKDEDRSVVGTRFDPTSIKVGNEELENWLLRLLSPKLNFRFHEIDVEGKRVVVLEIERASRQPVRFKDQEFIRVGSYKKKLKEFPEKERQLWRIFDITPFEARTARENVSVEEVFELLDVHSYFELLGAPIPETRMGTLEALEAEGLVRPNQAGEWDITNLGALLFANSLDAFPFLKRKAVRIVVYTSEHRLEAEREEIVSKGYASGFEGLISLVNALLPKSEVIERALRRSVPMYPELAIRELIPNALIHQDLSIPGTGPWSRSSQTGSRSRIRVLRWSTSIAYSTCHPAPGTKPSRRSCAALEYARSEAAGSTRWCSRPSSISCHHRSSRSPGRPRDRCSSRPGGSNRWTPRSASGRATCTPACAMWPVTTSPTPRYASGSRSRTGTRPEPRA